MNAELAKCYQKLKQISAHYSAIAILNPIIAFDGDYDGDIVPPQRRFTSHIQYRSFSSEVN